MTDISVIMSAPMVAATLREIEEPETGKAMTRRLLYSRRKVKNGIVPASATFLRDHPPPRGKLGPEGFPTDIAVDEYWALTGWHKVKPGDHLWVRESHWRLGRWIKMAALGSKAKWSFAPEHDGPESIMFEAPAECFTRPHRVHDDLSWWKRPSIFLPMKLSRLTLIVSCTKIEALQDITDKDAQAEGIVEDDGSEPDIWYVPGGWQLDVKRQGATAAEAFRYLWEALHGVDGWQANPDVVAIAYRPILANIDALPAAEAA